MMELSPGFWALILFGGGLALLLGEFLLPTHGVLGVLGVGLMAVAIGFCFYIGQWLGLSVLLGTMVAAPLVAREAVHLWPRSPLGRRLMLPPIADKVAPAPVKVGQVGRATSALRPMGTCDFAGQRIEVICEYGVVDAGQPVQVVNVDADRITVRPTEV